MPSFTPMRDSSHYREWTGGECEVSGLSLFVLAGKPNNLK